VKKREVIKQCKQTGAVTTWESCGGTAVSERRALSES